MHRNRLLSLARAAIPEACRQYVGHVARFNPERGVVCPHCNATRGVQFIEHVAMDEPEPAATPPDPYGIFVVPYGQGYSYAPAPINGARPVALLLTCVCPVCEHFTVMERAVPR